MEPPPLKVVTSIVIHAEPEAIWPLLTGATMQLPAPIYFRLGIIPTPLLCRISTDHEPGTGSARECISSDGSVTQIITEWQPYTRLSFTRTGDTAGLHRWLISMSDTFTLSPSDGGTTRLTRESIIVPKKLLRIPVSLGTRAVHRYVNRNFKYLAEHPHF